MSGGTRTMPRAGGPARLGVQVDGHVRLPATIRPHGVLAVRAEDEPIPPEPVCENADQPSHDELVDQIRRFLFFETPVDQLARIVFIHRRPLLEGHRLSKLGLCRMQRRGRHSGKS
jgi:hypothetical protein